MDQKILDIAESFNKLSIKINVMYNSFKNLDKAICKIQDRLKHIAAASGVDMDVIDEWDAEDKND